MVASIPPSQTPAAYNLPPSSNTSKGIVINIQNPSVNTADEPRVSGLAGAPAADTFTPSAGPSTAATVPVNPYAPPADQLAQAYSRASQMRQNLLNNMQEAENARNAYLQLAQNLNNNALQQQQQTPVAPVVMPTPAPMVDPFAAATLPGGAASPPAVPQPGFPAPAVIPVGMPGAPAPAPQTGATSAPFSPAGMPPGPMPGMSPDATQPPVPTPASDAAAIPPAPAQQPTPADAATMTGMTPPAAPQPSQPPVPGADLMAPSPATTPTSPAGPVDAMAPATSPEAAAAASPLSGAEPAVLNEIILSSNPQNNELEQMRQSAKKNGGKPTTEVITKGNRLQQQADAIGEIAIQSGLPNRPKFPPETVERLELISNLDTRNLKGQLKDDLDYFRQTALWTLGLLNASQNATVPTKDLPALKSMERIARDPKESVEVRKAAAQALQAANRASSNEMRQVLKRIENGGKSVLNPMSWFAAPAPDPVKKVIKDAQLGVPIQPAQTPGAPAPAAGPADMPMGMDPAAMAGMLPPMPAAPGGAQPQQGTPAPVSLPPDLASLLGGQSPAGMPAPAAA